MEIAGHGGNGRAAPGRPAHADRPWPPPRRVAAVALGGAALVAAAGLAAAGCLAAIGSSGSTPTSASLITVTPEAGSAPGAP
ncbi:MAG: hypothetical protein ACKOQ4_15135 [Mycobacterium sp.]